MCRGTGENYVGYLSVLLYVRVKITQANDNNLAEDLTATPINQLLHSMFSQVDTSLNGIVICIHIDAPNTTQLWRRCQEVAADMRIVPKKDKFGRLHSTLLVVGDSRCRQSVE